MKNLEKLFLVRDNYAFAKRKMEDRFREIEAKIRVLPIPRKSKISVHVRLNGDNTIDINIGYDYRINLLALRISKEKIMVSMNSTDVIDAMNDCYLPVMKILKEG